jgi:acyl-coenzyme A thioesterase PaaI-like protein
VNDRTPETAERPRHILQELGFAIWRAGDELHGAAEVLPEAHAPGTDQLRTSVLAAWTDNLAGLLAAETMMPRVPVTLELDVHLYRPAPADGRLVGRGRTVKRGRSVFVAQVEFATGDGEPVGVGAASFMLAPDPSVRLPADLSIGIPQAEELLSVPLAERARCVRLEPGVASLPKSDDGLNSSRTVNGGLIALAAEEAALSLTPGESLCSLGLRYLQAVRFGPVVATAEVRHGLGLVELRDTGNEERLCVLATTRTF